MIILRTTHLHIDWRLALATLGVSRVYSVELITQIAALGLALGPDRVAVIEHSSQRIFARTPWRVPILWILHRVTIDE